MRSIFSVQMDLLAKVNDAEIAATRTQNSLYQQSLTTY